MRIKTHLYAPNHESRNCSRRAGWDGRALQKTIPAERAPATWPGRGGQHKPITGMDRLHDTLKYSGPTTRNVKPPKPKGQGRGFFKNLAESEGEEMPILDWIHRLFLLYSGAHNTINAWHRAENVLFFVFVVVGILSVELMLWGVYKYWKIGRLFGKMTKVGKWAGFVAMFYATAGILAQAQLGTESAWLATYYQWILPTSAPAMFLFTFWVQAVDPIMQARRDAEAYEQLVEIEEKRGELDEKRMALDYKSDIRLLKQHMHKQKHIALMTESNSSRTKRALKNAMRAKMPHILKQIGVDPDIRVERNWLGRATRYQLPSRTASNDHSSSANGTKPNGSSKQSKKGGTSFP